MRLPAGQRCTCVGPVDFDERTKPDAEAPPRPPKRKLTARSKGRREAQPQSIMIARADPRRPPQDRHATSGGNDGAGRRGRTTSRWADRGG